MQKATTAGHAQSLYLGLAAAQNFSCMNTWSVHMHVPIQHMGTTYEWEF